MRKLLPCVAAVLWMTACTIPDLIRYQNDLPKYSERSGEWTEQWVVMRDGVKLKTYILLPEHAEHAPVMMMRNPYPALDLLKIQCGVFVRYGDRMHPSRRAWPTEK